MGETVDLHIGGYHCTEAIGIGGMGSVFRAAFKRNRMTRSILAALTVAVLCGAAMAGAPQRYAVVIGINEYADPAIPALKYAESDAKSVYDTLTDPSIGKFPKENVKLLAGKAATNDAIKESLQGLWSVGKDDLVVIFYSGHGAKEGEEAFWVTQAAKAKALPATALANSDIRKFMDKIPSQKLVVLLDCCYAASTVKKSLSDPGKLFGDFAGKGRVTIAGSADNQEALEYPDKKAGVFTCFLVSGLRGAADKNEDGVVTFDELWSYLGENVRTASIKQGGLHEPVIITEGGVSPQFLLTYNLKTKDATDKSIVVLRTMFDGGKITGSQFDLGRKLLLEPALDSSTAAQREVFADLVAGKLEPKYLEKLLGEAKFPAPATPSTPGQKPTLAVVPFRVLGEIKTKDAGEMLAEQLLPQFSEKYELVDQAQLKRFLDQDDLTVAGLVEVVEAPSTVTKGLSKAVKLRAVRMLVVGSISGTADGRLTVTARLTDWQTGKIDSSRIGQVAGENWEDLVKRLPLLAAKLSGSLEDIGPPPEPKLPPLPGGVSTLEARIQQFEAIKADLDKALETMTEGNPKVVFYRKKLKELGPALLKDIEAKVPELKADDAKLAEDYKPSHPQRQAVSEQIARLEKAIDKLSIECVKQITLDLGNKVTMKLALIPAGKFIMGSPKDEKDCSGDEGPQREVTISKPFCMGVYEVTQEQYEQIMGENPSSFKGAQNPVEQVSWDDAVKFCKALSKKTGKTASLPTEAQWEYACRAGTTTPFHTGQTISTDEVNYDGNYVYGNGQNGMYRKTTIAVGSFKPNDFGLYDMHGNVWEWCADWYGENYYSANANDRDPQGPDSGQYRVLRGGCWSSNPLHCRSANRYWVTTVDQNDNVGFRVSVDLK